MKNLIYCLLFCISFFSCTRKPVIQEWIVTTESDRWIVKEPGSINYSGNKDSVDFTINSDNRLQKVEGFGACFSELGWTSLSILEDNDREEIFREMFEPEYGAGFTFNRMPIGANDFARNWYSYNEVENDFAMDSFSIKNDFETLIPFIKTAQKYNPDMKLWASPWCPPAWMKYTGHYACRPDPQVNDLGSDMEYAEGTDLFIQEEKYFEAYALYFSKFIDAYREQGIDIFAVAPQNEFNSCQNFPSCLWSVNGLSEFIGKYLGPAMSEKNVDIIMGTVERGNWLLTDSILSDPYCKEYIKWVGFQWAGKDAVGKIHEEYPDLKVMQTESECGDGKNDWGHFLHTWNLIKHYFNRGCSAYEYWNISLEKDGLSRWAWRQNSLVSVDPDRKTYEYNYEYFLMKHLSRHVLPDSYFIPVEGSFENLIAFVRPDNKIAVIMMNTADSLLELHFRVDNNNYRCTLSPHSLNTVIIG